MRHHLLHDNVWRKAWHKKWKKHFDGLRIPFLAQVSFTLPRRDQKLRPTFASKSVPGVFLGYYLGPGGVFDKQYYVARLEDFAWNDGQTRHVRIFRTSQVQMPSEFKFPLREAKDKTIANSLVPPALSAPGEEIAEDEALLDTTPEDVEDQGGEEDDVEAQGGVDLLPPEHSEEDVIAALEEPDPRPPPANAAGGKRRLCADDGLLYSFKELKVAMGGLYAHSDLVEYWSAMKRQRKPESTQSPDSRTRYGHTLAPRGRPTLSGAKYGKG